MLNQLPVLVVEDEALIALDLVEAIKQVEGVPVGPIATVEEAMRLIDIQPVKAAILDANLLDRDVTPLALALIERDIPFVIHTATGLPKELAEQHPGSCRSAQACKDNDGPGSSTTSHLARQGEVCRSRPLRCPQLSVTGFRN